MTERKGVFIRLGDGRCLPIEVATLYRLPGEISEAELEDLLEGGEVLDHVETYDSTVETSWELVEVEGQMFWEIVTTEKGDE